MSQVFYRKWRPQTLAEVVGQEPVTRTLHNALATGRVAHAYLFCGPRGTGKTSTGRILAKAVNCLHLRDGEPCNTCTPCRAFAQGQPLDLIEIDAASNRGIDEIRNLREKVNFAPTLAKYKVYIIDEVHMLTEPAFSALLKTLEEPPPHALFVLATTEVHEVPPTILSRCQRFDFRRLPLEAMLQRLKGICEKEGIDIEPQALSLIARKATGSMRDAENLLEQAVTCYGSPVLLSQIEALLGVSGDFRVSQLARHLVEKDLSAGLALINSVAEDGLDLQQFQREVVEYLRGMLLVKAGSGEVVDLAPEALEEMRALAGMVSLGEISNAVKAFAQIDFRFEPQATLPFELALVECLLPGFEEQGDKVEGEGAQPSGSLDHVRQRWGEVVKALKGTGSKGNLDAYLRNACQPLALEGDTLVLGFYYDFHKAKIEDPKYRHLVEKKISEVFQAPYRLRCVLIDRGKRGPPPGYLVKAALEMGARITEVSREEGLKDVSSGAEVTGPIGQGPGGAGQGDSGS